VDRGATALIVAAGSGQRLGAGRPKALVELAGRPLYEWSLDACREASLVGPIVIAVPPGHADRFECGGAVVTAGGDTRARSVALAMEQVDTELVVVHDAARPLVTPALIDRTIRALAGDPALDAVIAASPVADTVKRIGPDGRIQATLDREALRLAQTPQVFRTTALRRAMTTRPVPEVTDEAMLIEAAGGSVGVVAAPSGNIKVTVPADLEYAAFAIGRNTSI